MVDDQPGSLADAAWQADHVAVHPLVAALWPQAERIARRLCEHSLWRLRRGDGGFYDDEDMMQDLFLEFNALLHRMARTGEDELWKAWRRALWGHGIRILRRPPQRLWSGGLVIPESAIRPARWGSETILDRLPDPLPGPAGSRGFLGAIDALERALWSLRPTTRQIVYMAELQGRTVAEISTVLGLGSNAVHQRLCRARRRLARDLGCEPGTNDHKGRKHAHPTQNPVPDSATRR